MRYQFDNLEIAARLTNGESTPHHVASCSLSSEPPLQRRSQPIGQSFPSTLGEEENEPTPEQKAHFIPKLIF